MMKHASIIDIASHKPLAVRAAIEQSLLGEHNPLLALMDIQGLRDAVKNLHESFPDNFTHCFAVKANPYLKFLKVLNESGMGAEVASSAELELALKAGFPVKSMVYDAPVKTRQEIDRALSLGITFNIDNFQELERVSKWLENNTSASSIGFRINPQIGAGEIESTSTATMTSKFGIGLEDSGNRERIIAACKQYNWINCIHVHVGSVACPIELMCEGIAVAANLVEEINTLIGTQQISSLDIGGGLPVDFTQDDNKPSFSDYAAALRNTVPVLFDGSYQVITEFGRAIAAKNAMTIGRVEYTKTMGGRLIALTHIGVQTLVRTVYDPENWKRRISAFDSNGQIKNCQIEGMKVSQDIAGPACFSGDLIARQRTLPLLEAGDYIAVHDTGAYHFSTHYQYNALPRLPVYGYLIDEQDQVTFTLFSTGQTVNDVIEDYS